jgi:hypothetical protein
LRYYGIVCAALLLSLLPVTWGAPDPALPLPGADLVNAGFDGPLDSSGTPEGWSRYISKFGTADLSVDNELKDTGAGSLKAEVGAKSACTVSQYLSVSDPGPFTFSCLVRTAAQATNGVQVSVEWFEAIDWPRRVRMVGRTFSSAVLYGDDTWQRLGAVAMKPDDADLALVAITVGDALAEAGTYWLDDADFSPGARPAPLLGNPGFELDLNNDGIPDNWGRTYYGEGWEIVRDETVRHSGSASARLTGQAGHGSRSVLSTQSSYLVPPQRLRVSFWYKGSGASDNLIDFLPGEGDLAANGTVYFERHVVKLELPQNEWTQFVAEYDVPDDAREFGRMRVDFLMYQRSEGTLWLDDFRLEVIE